MAMLFLEEILIAAEVIKFSTVFRYCQLSKLNHLFMILDGSAIESLDLLETSSGAKKGSLLHYIDHCRTPFGKRELKKWLIAPLMDVEEIRAR